jgi:hypothetical protein
MLLEFLGISAIDHVNKQYVPDIKKMQQSCVSYVNFQQDVKLYLTGIITDKDL